MMIKCPTVADDIQMMAKRVLQLHIAYQFANDWQFEYSALKCIDIVHDTDTEPQTPLRLGGFPLKGVQ